MKVFNRRIPTELGLTEVVNGLSGKPNPDSPYVETSQEEYLDNGTHANKSAAEQLVRIFEKGSIGNTPLKLKEVLEALSATNRAVLYSGRYANALAASTIGTADYGYVEHVHRAIYAHGVDLGDVGYSYPKIWVVTDKVITLPDVEQYSTQPDPSTLRIPLNFGITDYSKIRMFV